MNETCSRIRWELFVTEPGADFFPLYRTILIFLLVSCYVFYITSLFSIFSNSCRINFIVFIFLFVIQIICSVISPVINFFLKIVSYYFNILKLVVILICIFNRHLLNSCWLLLLLLNQMTSDMHNCWGIFFLLVVILAILNKYKRTSSYEPQRVANKYSKKQKISIQRGRKLDPKGILQNFMLS